MKVGLNLEIKKNSDSIIKKSVEINTLFLYDDNEVYKIFNKNFQKRDVEMKNKFIDFAQTIAAAISEVTTCNVTITDKNHIRIAGTGQYETLIGEKVPKHSAFDEAYYRHKTIVIENPTKAEICLQCSGIEHCLELYEICTPIFREVEFLGIIGIFANTKEQKKYIENKKDAFQNYLENMTHLLSAYISSEQLLIDNRLKRDELEMIMQYSDVGILLLDNRGFIKNINATAMRFFHIKGEKEQVIGNHIYALGESELFKRAVFTTETLENVEFILKTYDKKNIALSASVHRIIVEGKISSILFTVLDSNDIQKVAIRQRESKMDTSFDSLIGHSDMMQNVIQKAKIASAYDSTILIMGESGTGKELFARAIHKESPRSTGPFIGINCSAIPESLLESELFGYESGAFTGASDKGKVGKMELANHGTLFLDEIGDMPLFLQVKLLRVLQERRIMKIGGTKYLDLDIRIIAATNQDLEKMIQSQEFREDLYYRLNVIPLTLPPLRKRKSDISEITNYFLNYFNQRFHKNILGFTEDAMQRLINHKWKGNVRELENIIEYLVNFSKGPYITIEDVAVRIPSIEEEHSSLEMKVREFERKIINQKLQEYGNDLDSKLKIAKELGISLATLYRKLI
ncbi:Sigma-54 interaction domain protein [Peptostreptococcaceae bacterium oral taxon 113 str. W5053]|nr:Sigma-54 interaction domain protein [Peptostreptococcaceae bacterium oral taxon 113 str. W5053]